VGGGAIGCATAYFLARSGASVTLLERSELGGEASGAAAGMLAALSDEGGDRGPAFQKLSLDGLRLHQEILPDLESTGIDLRYMRSGVLHLAITDDEARHLRSRYDSQKRLSPAVRWLEGDSLHEEEPEVTHEAVAGLLSPEEHYLDPQRLVLALAEASRRLGVDIRTDAPVTRFNGRGGRIKSVRTGVETIEAPNVVIAAGPWTADIARRLGSYVPVVPMRGQMLALGPATSLRHVIWGEKAYLVPRENNLTFVGATVENVGFRKRTTVAAIRRLRRAAEEMIPGFTLARIASTWAGLRPGSPDGLPMLGLMPGWSNVWVATGHFRNGILLSAITGKLMSESILAGNPIEQLGPFDPSRFGEDGRSAPSKDMEGVEGSPLVS
jgi:glycine oxidase